MFSMHSYVKKKIPNTLYKSITLSFASMHTKASPKKVSPFRVTVVEAILRLPELRACCLQRTVQILA